LNWRNSFMNKYYLRGFIAAVALFVVLGLVFSSGWHIPSEILSGTFVGNYIFNGSLSVNNLPVANNDVATKEYVDASSGSGGVGIGDDYILFANEVLYLNMDPKPKNYCLRIDSETGQMHPINDNYVCDYVYNSTTGEMTNVSLCWNGVCSVINESQDRVCREYNYSDNSWTPTNIGRLCDLSTEMRCSFQGDCDFPGRIVFVTSSSTHTGNIGGISGANAVCQGLAEVQGYKGTFKAWLSSTTYSPATHFDQRGSFYLVTGTKIADNWSDLTDGTIDNVIDRNETGSSVAAPNIWTGTGSDGNMYNSIYTCTDWTSTSGHSYTGSYSYTDYRWTRASSVSSCANQYRLYCFQDYYTG
jgi:hypothetical protein